jgi:hypothetical protein
VIHIFKTKETRVAMTSTIKGLDWRLAVLEKDKDKESKGK